MFLGAVIVVLLSVLYLLYSLQDEQWEAPTDGSVGPAAAACREAHGPRAAAAINIFFGSQTGKAETFARLLARRARSAPREDVHVSRSKGMMRTCTHICTCDITADAAHASCEYSLYSTWKQ